MYARFTCYSEGGDCDDSEAGTPCELDLSRMQIFACLPFISKPDAYAKLTCALFSQRVPEDLLLNLDEKDLAKASEAKDEIEKAVKAKKTHPLLDKADLLRKKRVACLYKFACKEDEICKDEDMRPRLFCKRIACSRHYPSIQQTHRYEGVYYDVNVEFTPCCLELEECAKDSHNERKKEKGIYYIKRGRGLAITMERLKAVLKYQSDTPSKKLKTLCCDPHHNFQNGFGSSIRALRRLFPLTAEADEQLFKDKFAAVLPILYKGIALTSTEEKSKEHAEYKAHISTKIVQIVDSVGLKDEEKPTATQKEDLQKEIHKLWRWNCGPHGVGVSYLCVCIWCQYGNLNKEDQLEKCCKSARPVKLLTNMIVEHYERSDRRDTPPRNVGMMRGETLT